MKGGLLSPLPLTEAQVLTLEAFADTIIPGVKRHEHDVAIAGIDATPGAVQAGALDVLMDPAAGLDDGVGPMADLLNEHAADQNVEGSPDQQEGAKSPNHGWAGPLPAFVNLDYACRRALVTKLTSREHPEHELWFLMALFSYVAFDSAPHMDTATALKQGHPGLIHLGFLPPDADGLWRSPKSGYGRPTAEVRSGTDQFGNLS